MASLTYWGLYSQTTLAGARAKFDVAFWLKSQWLLLIMSVFDKVLTQSICLDTFNARITFCVKGIVWCLDNMSGLHWPAKQRTGTNVKVTPPPSKHCRPSLPFQLSIVTAQKILDNLIVRTENITLAQIARALTVWQRKGLIDVWPRKIIWILKRVFINITKPRFW